MRMPCACLLPLEDLQVGQEILVRHGEQLQDAVHAGLALAIVFQGELLPEDLLAQGFQLLDEAAAIVRLECWKTNEGTNQLGVFLGTRTQHLGRVWGYNVSAYFGEIHYNGILKMRSPMMMKRIV